MAAVLNSMQIVTRNFASLAGAQFTNLGITFVSSVMVIRYLGVAHYGEYSLVITLVALFGFAIDLGLTQLVVREVSQHRDQSSRYLSNFLIVQAIVALIFFILLVIFVNVLHYPEIIRLGTYIVGSGMVVGALVRPFTAILTAREEMHIIAAVNVLVSIANFFIVLGLINFNGSLNTFFVLSLVTNLLTLGLITWLARRYFRVELHLDRGLIRHLLIMTIPFAMLMLFNIVYGKVDVFMISRIINSDTAVGLYSSAYRIIDALIIVPATVSSVLFPIIARNIGDQGATNFVGSRAIKFTAALGLPIAFGAVLVGTPLIVLLFGQSFIESGTVLKYLIWMIALISSYSILGNILLSANRVKLLVKLNAIGIVINVGMNLYLIPRYGIIGAAISSVGAEVIIMALHAFFARQYVRFGQLRTDFLKILIACGAMVGVFYLLPEMHVIVTIGILAVSYGLMLLILRFIQPVEKDLLRQILPKAKPASL
ncbi:MAG: flippase [Candidatus Kerfeldbacteria bacterium]|nr:flippase [Candidatus Kerfeldbacteria bacterium]